MDPYMHFTAIHNRTLALEDVFPKEANVTKSRPLVFNSALRAVKWSLDVSQDLGI